MIRKTAIWSRTVSHMQNRSNVGDKTVGFCSIYIFISIIIYCATIGAYQYESETNKKLMRTRGDVVLGGIFPMHEQINTNNEYPCGDIKKEKVSVWTALNLYLNFIIYTILRSISTLQF